MGLFDTLNSLKAKVYEGKNLLEALVASGILAAAADGDIGQDEITKLQGLLIRHKKIGNKFSASEIRDVIENMAAKAGDNAGRRELFRELRDIRKDAEAAEDACFFAVDVIQAGGGEFTKEEKDRVKEIIKELGESPEKYFQ